MAIKELATLEHGSKLRVISDAVTDWRPALKEIGLMMLFSSVQAFKRQKRGSHKWLPRAVPNVVGILSDFERGAMPPRRRFGDAKKAGMDTGALLASLAPGKLSAPTATTIEVGTRIAYASRFASGGPVSKRITETIRDRLASYLDSNPQHSERLAFLFGRDTYDSKVPPRPFLLFTRQDRRDASEILQAHIKRSR